MEKGNVYTLREMEENEHNCGICDLCQKEANMNDDLICCIPQKSKAKSIHGDVIDSGIDICSDCCKILLKLRKN